MEGEKEDRMEGRREEKRERDRQMRQTDEHTDTHTHIEERQRWGKKERVSLNFPFYFFSMHIQNILTNSTV